MEKRASNGSDSNFEFLKDIPNKSRAKKTVLTKTVFFLLPILLALREPNFDHEEKG